MTTKHQAGSFVAVFIAACGLAACTTTAAKPDGGGGSGGSTGVGGSHGGSTGTGGSTGAVAACGSGPYAPLEGTVCKLPDSSGTITDFTYDPDSGATDQVRFGNFGTTLSGGEDVYANAPGTMTSDVTGNDWHISGNVANYAGFALYFDNVNSCNMADASAFSGISFTIWGTTGGMPITMGVSTLDDTVTPSWLASVDAGSATPTPGSCIPTSGNGPYYHPGCGDPSTSITVATTATSAATAQTVTLHWATDFPTGGACEAYVKASQILSIYWQFPWATNATPYNVDIHIDNLKFVP
jgi:hypothetical protein